MLQKSIDFSPIDSIHVVGDDALENKPYQTVSTSQAKQAHGVCTCVRDCM